MLKFQAILFDLDGTLLDSNMENFLPHYFCQAGPARVAHLAPPKAFIAHLLAATEQMLANDGRATNEEVFAAAFYPFAGHSRAELEPIFDDFYAARLPGVASSTRSASRKRGTVVQLAFALGHEVAIATNPLFPETAIRAADGLGRRGRLPLRVGDDLREQPLLQAEPALLRRRSPCAWASTAGGVPGGRRRGHGHGGRPRRVRHLPGDRPGHRAARPTRPNRPIAARWLISPTCSKHHDDTRYHPPRALPAPTPNVSRPPVWSPSPAGTR